MNICKRETVRYMNSQAGMRVCVILVEHVPDKRIVKFAFVLFKILKGQCSARSHTVCSSLFSRSLNVSETRRMYLKE